MFGDALGRQDQVCFVFTVVVVQQDHRDVSADGLQRGMEMLAQAIQDCKGLGDRQVTRTLQQVNGTWINAPR